MTEYAHLSCSEMCVDVSSFSSDFYEDKRATLNRRQKNEISNSETFVTETKQVSWNLLTNIILHGRTIGYMINSVMGAIKKAVEYYFRIYDLGKNGLQSSDDLSMKSKYEFVSGDPNINFLYISIQDDDKEKSVEMCLHEVDPSQNTNENVKAIIIADTRHPPRRFGRKITLILRDGFFCNSPATSKHLRPRTHERTPGISRNLGDLETD